MAQFINFFRENPRRRAFIVGVSGFTILLIITLFSDYGLVNRFRMDYEKVRLNENLQQQKNISDSLKNEIKLLQTDTLTIERVAREKYGMKKKNEELMIIRNKVEEKK
jgi:cell division protein FtsB